MKKSILIGKLLLLLVVFVIFNSCSNDDVEPKDDSKSLSVTIREDFARHPQKNLWNIVVGDTLFYEITVEDSQFGGEMIYTIDLNNEDGKFHRRLNKDYRAFILEKEKMSGDSIVKEDLKKGEVKTSLITLHKPGIYILMILPLEPGTFQHVYNFKKRQKDDTSVETITKEINFNCVRLIVWYRSVQTRHKTLFRHSKHLNEFYIRIEDGERETDRYLQNQQNRELTYQINYDGGTYTGEFQEGVDICYYKTEEREGAPPEVTEYEVSRIKIRQKDMDKDEIIIEYHNVELIKK